MSLVSVGLTCLSLLLPMQGRNARRKPQNVEPRPTLTLTQEPLEFELGAGEKKAISLVVAAGDEEPWLRISSKTTGVKVFFTRDGQSITMAPLGENCGARGGSGMHGRVIMTKPAVLLSHGPYVLTVEPARKEDHIGNVVVSRIDPLDRNGGGKARKRYNDLTDNEPIDARLTAGDSHGYCFTIDRQTEAFELRVACRGKTPVAVFMTRPGGINPQNINLGPKDDQTRRGKSGVWGSRIHCGLLNQGQLPTGKYFISVAGTRREDEVGEYTIELVQPKLKKE